MAGQLFHGEGAHDEGTVWVKKLEVRTAGREAGCRRSFRVWEGNKQSRESGANCDQASSLFPSHLRLC